MQFLGPSAPHVGKGGTGYGHEFESMPPNYSLLSIHSLLTTSDGTGDDLSMRQAEDLVWAAITDSAKRRFDYVGFKNGLSASGDERVAEYILFQIIEGLAEELTSAELLLKIRGDLELFGYPVSEDELNDFLADKPAILSAEVDAAREALSGFAQGRSASDLLEQMHQLLSIEEACGE